MDLLRSIVLEYQNELMPKEYFDYTEFDELMSPMINNPKPLFEFLTDGHNINILEVMIALIIFAKHAAYDERI